MTSPENNPAAANNASTPAVPPPPQPVEPSANTNAAVGVAAPGNATDGAYGNNTYQLSPRQGNSGLNPDGFLKAMLDLNFERFVTIKFAKIIYLLVAVIIVLQVLTWPMFTFFAAASNDEVGLGFFLALLVFIVTLICGVINLIAARVILEAAVALIRVAQNTTEMKEKL